MRSLPLIVFSLLLGLGQILFAADNWTMDGNGGVYWTNGNGTISAYPAYSITVDSNHEQFINTSYTGTSGTVNMSFVFPYEVTNFKVYTWYNGSYLGNISSINRTNHSYTFPTSNTTYSTSSLPCDMGDSQNTMKYAIAFTYGISTNLTYCFNSYNGSTIYYQTNDTTYIPATLWKYDYWDVTNVSVHGIYENKMVATYLNVPFPNGSFYMSKISYYAPPVFSTATGSWTGGDGKYSIYAHSGSAASLIAGTSQVFLELDPFYNSTGGAVTYDGNYTVVTFTANGTFNVTGEINATVLVVAGGGGGGSNYGTGAGGGGGAGGLIYNTSYNATGNITVVVGLGSAVAATTNQATAARGQNSSFGTLIANGGGGGTSYLRGTPGSGGSGGGASQEGGVAGGSATPAGQGHDGGTSIAGQSAAGGGGAGEVGQAPTPTGGSGGTGLYYSINGTSVCYAGGGGGGYGGLGGGYGNNSTNQCGGGNGTNIADTLGGTAGKNGTGGGGGAGTSSYTGAAGGNGIVIVRYLTYVDVSPVVNSSTILPSPAYTNASLQLWCNATTADAANVTYNYTAYLNGVVNVTGNTSSTTQGINTNVANISNISLAVGQNWTLQCSAYNANGASAFLNSSVMTILSGTTYYSMIGNATNWVWGTLQTGNTTISGNATKWTWRTWTPGSGRMIRNGSATSWTWVTE